MKYGKILLEIIKNQKIKDDYINYKELKQKINDNNIENILINTIVKFDKSYKNKKNKYNYYDVYCYLLINYLTIHKFLKI